MTNPPPDRPTPAGRCVLAESPALFVIVNVAIIVVEFTTVISPTVTPAPDRPTTKRRSDDGNISHQRWLQGRTRLDPEAYRQLRFSSEMWCYNFRRATPDGQDLTLPSALSGNGLAWFAGLD